MKNDDNSDVFNDNKKIKTSVDAVISKKNIAIKNVKNENKNNIKKFENFFQNETSNRYGFNNQIIQDLLATNRIINKISNKYPLLNQYLINAVEKKNSKIKYSKNTKNYKEIKTEYNSATKIVNTLLTLYSNATYQYCVQKNINVPLAWENFDNTDNNFNNNNNNKNSIRRFSTQPLRNWLSQQQQKQIRGALKMELPLSRDQCALAVSYHNTRRKYFASFLNKGREQMAFEYFQSHCTNMMEQKKSLLMKKNYSQEEKKSNNKNNNDNNYNENDIDSRNNNNNIEYDSVVVSAEGLGKGSLVRIHAFNLNGIVMNAKKEIEKGSLVQARVQRVVPTTRTIYLELV
jgi:hypothetical protein